MNKGFIFTISTILLLLSLFAMLNGVDRIHNKNDQDVVDREAIKKADYVFDDISNDLEVLLEQEVNITQRKGNTTIYFADSAPLPERGPQFQQYKAFLESSYADGINGDIFFDLASFNENKLVFSNNATYVRELRGTTTTMIVFFNNTQEKHIQETMRIRAGINGQGPPPELTEDAGGDLNIVLDYADNTQALYQDIMVDKNGGAKSIEIEYGGEEDYMMEISFVEVNLQGGIKYPGMRVKVDGNFPVEIEMGFTYNNSEEITYVVEGLDVEYAGGNASKSGNVEIGGDGGL